MTLSVNDPPCPVRLGTEDDLPYLLECWVRHMARTPGRTIRFWKKWVLKALAQEGMVVRVAHVEGDEDAILGFAVLELAQGPVPPCLHHVYVRDKARRCGVARSLLADLGPGPVDYTGRPSLTLPVPQNFRPAPGRVPADPVHD